MSVEFCRRVAAFGMGSGGAYSSLPYLVVYRIDVWQTARAPESLMIIVVGARVVLPVIVVYSVFAYRMFGGKVRALDHG